MLIWMFSTVILSHWQINKAIADMKADGEFNTLYKKWFNVDAPADMPVVVEFK